MTNNHTTLEFTPEVEQLTQPIYDRIKHVMPDVEWPIHAPVIAAINELKKTRNAIIMAHNYQTPEVFYGVGDITGDSLALAQQGAKVDADVIVMCGVKFMAETAKILSPEKTVLLPDLSAGCSLAESVSGADIRKLKEQYPGVPVVTYVNAYADVRAEADICCTSGNAVKIVESLNTERVIFVPDGYLGRYVAQQTDVEVILWEGTCEVHERFTADELCGYRKTFPGIHIVAHPECPPDVLSEADFVGSTAGMIDHIGTKRPKQVVMVTECSMSDNVAIEYPDVDFIRPCNLCPHMKYITLPKILIALQTLAPQIEVDEDTAERARRSLERMLAV
ncbi:MAG TPA: quinolinate synthase NadA [Gammaproteobacteria bacterium]|nr:quinolinate synthase NadA [Gammaproteobacteria bacterium]MDP7296695.1 quinolinate synthase NadA [Gammaproteobacteria bacterium]MDP7660816.1 quinolinate synthase NadA [Gammaproteobacteria bacterium]HJP38718.1 quinolinate synthase NadA [Gammaproteobacteria bacterium]